MGLSFSLQTQINNINNSIENELEQNASASATANCDVTIGNITFKETKGCTITVKNLCSAEADAQLSSVNDVVSNFFDKLTTEQKNNVPMIFTETFGVSTTVNNFKNDYSNHVKQICTAFAQANPTLKINNIEIDKCESTGDNILELKFINTGTALGQCGIQALNKLLANASSVANSSQSTGIDFTALIWPIVICVCIISIITFLIKFFFQKKEDGDDIFSKRSYSRFR